MLQQPLHGALATPGQAVVHFLGLLGNMDVDGRARIQRREALHGHAQAVGRHGAQRVRRQAQGRALGTGLGQQALQQCQHVVRAADEARLVGARQLAAEAAGLVEHGQQGDAHAGLARGAQQGQ